MVLTDLLKRLRKVELQGEVVATGGPLEYGVFNVVSTVTVETKYGQSYQFTVPESLRGIYPIRIGDKICAIFNRYSDEEPNKLENYTCKWKANCAGFCKKAA